jgi:hypothetical protein
MYHWALLCDPCVDKSVIHVIAARVTIARARAAPRFARGGAAATAP